MVAGRSVSNKLNTYVLACSKFTTTYHANSFSLTEPQFYPGNGGGRE